MIAVKNMRGAKRKIPVFGTARRAERLRETLSLADSVSLEGLSAAQLRFAERERAAPGQRGVPEGVFLYREEPSATYRWLVARDGHVLDTMTFFNHPVREPYGTGSRAAAS